MRRPLFASLAASLAMLGWLAACRSPAPGGNRGDAEDPMDAMPGMAPMKGMPGGDTMATAFWDSLRLHLDSVIQLEPNRLVFVRAAHDSLARRALERMHREMASMSMPPDGAWRALEDSVRGDLERLHGLAGEAFVLRMRGHGGRLKRLIAMHERMMADMAM